MINIFFTKLKLASLTVSCSEIPILVNLRKMAAMVNHSLRRYLQTSLAAASKQQVLGPSAVSGGHEGIIQKFLIKKKY